MGRYTIASFTKVYRNKMEAQQSVSQFITSYPVDLAISVERIQEEVPSLFPVMKEAAGGAISIKLAVDLPTEGERVSLSRLREKSISTEGLREDEAGWVTINELAQKNIVICEELLPAYWKWSDRVIYVSHSSYGNECFSFQEYHQVSNILFEMHNACQTKRFSALTDPKNKTSKLDFVRAFEEIEHDAIILTRRCLTVLSKNEKFDQDFNIYKNAYDDAELHFMHQQLMGHSYAIAKRYDNVFFPHAKKELFQGTWVTKFEEGNQVHQYTREILYEILNEQIDAIANDDRSKLDAMLKKVRIEADSGKEWARLVMLNLNFFQGRYQEYVRREKPAVVVNLEEPRFFTSLIQWIRGYTQTSSKVGLWDSRKSNF